MSKEDWVALWCFLAGLVMGGFGAAAFVALNIHTDARAIEHAESLCSVNGGIEWVDNVDARCKNGAVFDHRHAPTEPSR